ENASEDPDDAFDEWVKVSKASPVIEIDGQRTVRLVTVKHSTLGDEYSDISWYYLGIKPNPVTADPESGIYDEVQHITLETETKGAKIYYTTDGSDPRNGGILYTIPLTLNKDTTVRAAAYYDGQWSDLSSFWYVFQIVDDYGVDAFYPSGVYEGSVNVTLTPNTPENDIIYSIDGGETWQPYEDTITLEENTEIIAKAVDKNGKEGGEYKFTYTIKPLPPEFAPESTQFTNADSMSIHCIERTNENFARYALYYTLDGSDPITSDTRILADEIADNAIIPINKYTVVTAAVLRDGTTWSDVVQHSYDIVVSKPVKPLTTLLPGYYTREIGSDPFTTQFVPVPTGTKIYYTIAYGDEIKPDPIPGEDGTYEYTPGDEIDIKGKTIIKAVAVNSFGAKSDIGIFEYVVTPEAPVAAPSAIIGGDKLPVVPVETVEGSTVYYKVENFENVIEDAPEKFYIDMSTGNAYEDEECTEPIGEYENNKTYTDSAMLEISAELDDIESEKNVYFYGADGDDDTLAPPYADKKTGTYEEINADGNNNFLIVHLDSLNEGDTIEYMTDNSGVWEEYDGEGLALNKDTVLQIRSVKGDAVSPVASYVYEFIPLPPIITLPSGRYSADPDYPKTFIEYDDRIPTNANYNIFYRANGEKLDALYTGVEREIKKTMFFKAYVINEDTLKKSKNAINYYIIEQVNAQEGNVYTAYPYEVNPGDTKYLPAHILDDKDYNEGIKLYTNNKNANIRYHYTYTRTDGTSVTSEIFTYDNATPIFVNSSMKDIQITAWLVDKEGTYIDN
ncbi:MAG: chitobiase/beta-hexosaminidase C-terminal domain-containing protein, partial [Clostridia bacterium]|nr:chitobiase/beta-hexosaminidase C-terminal domain-containing protein [Clostridia bacterium]